MSGAHAILPPTPEPPKRDPGSETWLEAFEPGGAGALVQANDDDHERPEDLLTFQTTLMGAAPAYDGVLIAAKFQPLTGVSGDFWDMRMLDDGALSIIQGDVSGHGTTAALVMAVARKLASIAIRTTPDPCAAMLALNDALLGETGGKYLTASALRIASGARQATLVRCGHTPLLHWDAAAGVMHKRLPKGMAVGMQPSAMMRRVIVSDTFGIGPGDRLVLYTDGLKESMNLRQEEYGDDLIMDIVGTNHADTPAMIVDRIINGARHFRGAAKQNDDEMVICLSVT